MLTDPRPVSLDVMIGRAVRHLRKSRGWSQQMLAARLGVRVARVRGYERGAWPVHPRILLRLGRAFGVPLSAFFKTYRRE